MAAPARILVIRLGALGDLVLCFQAFQDIRAAYPDAEIALLTMPGFADFTRAMPWFNRVLIDERPSFLEIAKWQKLLRAVRVFNPNQVFDLQGKLRQTLLYFWLGPKHVVWSGAAPLCDHPRLWPPEQGMHFTDFVAAQLRLADVPPGEPANLQWLNAPLDKFSPPERYALLIPGCAPGRDYKRWPASRYADIATRLQTLGISTLAVGTTMDAGSIATLCKIAPHVADLAGKTSLLELAALARRASCVLGNDTGPVHLAASVGAPTLALMSDNVDPLWSAPKGPYTKWLQGKPLNELSSDKVFLALREMLDRKA